jgi:hypothetical protein
MRVSRLENSSSIDFILMKFGNGICDFGLLHMLVFPDHSDDAFWGGGGKQGLRPTTRDSYGRLVLGDVITSVNGKKISNGSDLYKILDRCKVGDTVQ